MSESKKKYEILSETAKELEISKEKEKKQFKQLLLDKEEEIQLLSSKQDSQTFEENFQELNQLLNDEKFRNAELQSKHEKSIEIIKGSAQVALDDNKQLREKIVKLEKELELLEKSTKSNHGKGPSIKDVSPISRFFRYPPPLLSLRLPWPQDPLERRLLKPITSPNM